VATGQDYDMEKIYEVGMRIYTMRHAFNLREGINPLTRNVPGRMIGDPPLKEGNVRDITVDYKLLLKEFLEQIGWDTATTVPGDETLRKLDLDFLIEDLKNADVPAA
jgi:aldehyde:ferredoxin oxidoreductase